MNEHIFYRAGTTAASGYAAEYLRSAGYVFTDQPDRNVTDLLLDVPSFRDDGSLRGGGSVHTLLEALPESITVYGGNLNCITDRHKKIDLLQDSEYVAKNAYITAECALQVAAQHMSVIFRGCPVLIIGWGRIGKCLGKLLNETGADVTIAARKETDRAMIRALGYRAADPAHAAGSLSQYRLIFNTAPSLVLSREEMSHCRSDCVKIDLASKPGMLGEGVIWARGLPGIHAPESSGILIAQTIIRSLKEA